MCIRDRGRGTSGRTGGEDGIKGRIQNFLDIFGRIIQNDRVNGYDVSYRKKEMMMASKKKKMIPPVLPEEFRRVESTGRILKEFKYREERVTETVLEEIAAEEEDLSLIHI